MSSPKPNFLCIGAQKAGTTWLYKMMQHHPDVWLPPMKEIHYFDHVHLGHIDWQQKRLEQLQTAVGQFANGNFSLTKLKFLSKMAITDVMDDDYYLNLFTEAQGKIVADITPDYSALNDAGFAHLTRLLPEAKIVFIMRNPIRRAWSQAVMRKRKALASEQKIQPQQWLKIIDNQRNYRLSNYTETVRLCKKYLAPENRLFLIYDDICLNPLATLQKICQFLEIDYRDEFFAPVVKQKFNANPPKEIPFKIEAFLRQQLAAQETFVQQTFTPDSFRF